MIKAAICCMQNGQFVLGRKCPACPGFIAEGEPSLLSDLMNFPDEFVGYTESDVFPDLGAK